MEKGIENKVTLETRVRKIAKNGNGKGVGMPKWFTLPQNKERVFITNIEWDTDEYEVDLPNRVEMPRSIIENYSWNECDSENDLDEMEFSIIADYLADEYGWCVKDFNVNFVRTKRIYCNPL